MLHIYRRQEGKHGAVWFSSFDHEKRHWMWVVLPQLIQQEHQGWPTRPLGLQRSSDLGLRYMPYYLAQVPSTFFFPYFTYGVGMWFQDAPTFVIPRPALDRLRGRYWLDALARWPLEWINPMHKDWQQAWLDPQGNAKHSLSYEDVLHRAAAAQTYLLDGVRFVYDQNKSLSDGSRTNEPSRYRFGEELADFATTKEYLRWYIEQCNAFFEEFITFAKQCRDDECRRRALIAGWTVNRIAVDAFVTMCIDAPYIRKWQFFAILDAIASLRNELDGTGHDRGNDARTAQEFLTKAFFEQTVQPIVEQIPNQTIRNAVMEHSERIYDQVDELALGNRSGPQLIWDYRNSRHGYATWGRDRLFLHDGIIPDNLPDLTIALWHFVLQTFPF